MRATSISRLLALILLAIATPSFAQNEIPWISDPYQARQLAQQQQRLLLLHFYTDWCAPCKRLERDVFPRPEVARSINGNFIAAKINAEQFQEIARQYQIKAYPTDVITDPSGREIYRGVTPQDPIKYCSTLDKVAADSRFAVPANGLANRAPAQNPAQFSSYPTGQDRFGGERDPGYGTNGVPGGGGVFSPSVDLQRPVNYGPSSPLVPVQPPVGRGPYANPYVDQDGSDRPRDNGAPPAGADPRQQGNPYVVGNWAGQAPGGQNPGYAGSPYPGAPRTPGGAFIDNRTLAPPAGGIAQTDPYRRNSGSRADVAQRPAAERRELPSARPAAQAPPVAMEGFCLVTLAEEERWQKGDPQWGAIHRGQTYLFATQQQQQKFLADPDRYSPALSGYDPIRFVENGELVPGKRQHGTWYRGKFQDSPRIYLFADEPNLERFEKSAELYAQKAHEAMMNAR